MLMILLTLLIIARKKLTAGSIVILPGLPNNIASFLDFKGIAWGISLFLKSDTIIKLLINHQFMNNRRGVL